MKYATLIHILVLGFFLRLHYAHLDPYLHAWDERYHALVAKNLMDDPLLPLLRAEPLVPYDDKAWCCNHIWVHKQPLFMWQMAASMAIFGVSEFAMRYPSVLMGCLMILLCFRITMLLTQHWMTSIVAALIMSTSNYHLEQVSGWIGMDHNDVAFSFYILASIWAYAEYRLKNKLFWALLVGVFCGLAMLNKWLTGLLVFLPWTLLSIYHFYIEKKVKMIVPIFLALITSFAIFLPWQVYLFHQFPELARYEMTYNQRHLTEVLEGHGGSAVFYLERFPQYFGTQLYLLVPAGIWVAWYHRKRFDLALNYTLSLCLLVVLFFFSIVAQTKLPSYVFIIAPIGFIYIAIAINALFDLLPTLSSKTALLTVVCLSSLSYLNTILKRKDNTERQTMIENTRIYKSLKNLLPQNYHTIINANSYEDIDIMFFNDGIIAYHWWPDEKYADSLAQKGVFLASMPNRGAYVLPHKYASYPGLHYLNVPYK